MAKKKKITQEQERSKHFEEAKKALDAGKIVTVNQDAIINVPMVGWFREYLSETLNYIFSLKDEQETMIVLQHIREGFKNIPKKDENGYVPYDPYMNACWTLITLITEINHQAAEQGHTIVTDQNFDETMSNLVNSFQIGKEEHTEAAFKQTQEAYNKKVSDDNKESAYDGEKAGQTSSED